MDKLNGERVILPRNLDDIINTAIKTVDSGFIAGSLISMKIAPLAFSLMGYGENSPVYGFVYQFPLMGLVGIFGACVGLKCFKNDVEQLGREFPEHDSAIRSYAENIRSPFIGFSIKSINKF